MPMGRKSLLFVELRRRHVFRVAGIYIVSAWVVLQVADLALESFGLSGCCSALRLARVDRRVPARSLLGLAL